MSRSAPTRRRSRVTTGATTTSITSSTRRAAPRRVTGTGSSAGSSASMTGRASSIASARKSLSRSGPGGAFPPSPSTTEPSVMKITAIHAIPLAIPMKPMDPPSTWRAGTRKQIVVRVVTDEGLTGTGEAFAYGAPLAVVSVIDESLAPLLVGQDPLRIEALVDLMHRGTMIYGRRGLAMFAISGVEIALWDLLGKALNAPVCALLGGAIRPRLPVYASLLRYDSPGDVARARSHCASPGFSRPKLHQTDVESVRAAREAAGPDVEVMLDTNCPWSPEDAIRMARARAP